MSGLRRQELMHQHVAKMSFDRGRLASSNQLDVMQLSLFILRAPPDSARHSADQSACLSNWAQKVWLHDTVVTFCCEVFAEWQRVCCSQIIT